MPQLISDQALSINLKTLLNYSSGGCPRINERLTGVILKTHLGKWYVSILVLISGTKSERNLLSQIIRKETRNDHDELKHLSHEKLILSSLPTISFLFSMPILRRDSTLLTNFNFIPFQN